MKKTTTLTALILGLILAAASGVAYAQTTVNVTIGYPSNSNGDLGIQSGIYWIGQFPIQIASGGTSYPDNALCLNYDNTINEGSTYQANITPANDTAQWRAVSYILSWNAPADSNSAAVDQVAIWRLIDNYNPAEFNLPTSIEDAAANLAATANGKDVVRQGDQLTWITPSTGSTSANPGQTTTFQVQLTNSTGAPRPNVQINFNATLQPTSGPNETLNDTYVSQMEAFTDGSGLSQVDVTVPMDAPYGSTITVTAQTQSAWPQEYLDLTNYVGSAQNLIGTGPAFDLTVSTNIYILGYITVLPESAYGALTALIAFAAAFVIFRKLRHQTKENTPNFISKHLGHQHLKSSSQNKPETAI